MSSSELTVQQATSPMSIIQTAVQNNVPAAELKQLMDLQCQWERTRAEEKYAEALAGFKADCPIIPKGNPVIIHGKEKYRFASYDDIKKITKPIEKAHGISVDFSITEVTDGVMHGYCRVRVGSFFEDKPWHMPVPDASKQGMNECQEYGAALSYFKRYSYCAALDIVVSGEDDDTQSVQRKDEPKIEAKVTQKQASSLRVRVEGLGMDHGKYIGWLATKNKAIKDYEDIPASWYAGLDEKLKKKEEDQARDIEQGAA